MIFKGSQIGEKSYLNIVIPGYPQQKRLGLSSKGKPPEPLPVIGLTNVLSPRYRIIQSQIWTRQEKERRMFKGFFLQHLHSHLVYQNDADVTHWCSLRVRVSNEID